MLRSKRIANTIFICFTSTLFFVYISYLELLKMSPSDQTLTQKSVSRWEEFDPKDCELDAGIYLRKIHRTGASILENIIFRVGYYQDRSNYLESVFESGFYLQESEKDLSSRKFIPTSLETYDIVSEFGTKIRGQLSVPASKFSVTMLRDPTDLFSSLYQHFTFNNTLHMTANQFIDRLEMDDLLVHYKLHNNYGLNHQLGELGLRHINGERQAEHMIKVIEEVYDFVAIYELLPESLVLLAHHLCIPLANVTYLIPDERQHKNSIHWSQASKLKNEYQVHDERLYAHFRKLLEKEIKAFGQKRMEKSLKILRGYIEYRTMQCSSYDPELEDQPEFDCLLMTTEGMEDALYDRVYGAKMEDEEEDGEDSVKEGRDEANYEVNHGDREQGDDEREASEGDVEKQYDAEDEGEQSEVDLKEEMDKNAMKRDDQESQNGENDG